jgi:hypothetical protein
MVQFHNSDRSSTGPTDYWKLDTGNNLTGHGLREALVEKRFAVLKSANNTRLRVLYVRAQRGLMSYEGMSTRDLRLYMAQRGKKVIYVPKATKTTIKAQLEQADEDSTFDRFSDHPPELRQNIFQIHFDSSTTERLDKTQPPVTQVSHTFRNESLPLFYDSYDLQLVPEGHVRDPYIFQASTKTADLIKDTNILNLGRVKSIQLDFNNLNTRVTIDLDNEDEPVSLAAVYWRGLPGLTPPSQDQLQQLLSELRTFVLSMAARQKPYRFQVGDMQKVGEKVRSILGVATTP